MKLLPLTTIAFCLLPLACDDTSTTPFPAGGGGVAAVGGAGAVPGGGVASGVGGAANPGDTGVSPAGGASAATTVAVGPGSYALPPPSECSNQWSVQGCIKGDASSTCGGLCSNSYGPTSRSACEDPSIKPGVPAQFACPRHILFSSEMVQAVIDDGYEGKFNYAIVGHDPDTANLDAGLPNSCCQCYQLVYEKPTYLTNSTLTPPKPLIVQSANTQASGALGFDVFMGAGGLGAFNACGNVGDNVKPVSAGTVMYTAYPALGQPGNGGIKPGPDSLKCSDASNNLTDALIAAESCQAKVTSTCNQITAASSMVQEETRKSCIQSNQATAYYHENWNVYAKRVACPDHLTQVTGCKPDQTGVPAPLPDVQTAAQAAAAGFSAGYHTTTMQDCCMPTCAWKNHVTITTLNGYNTMYSCREDGSPVTQ